MIKFELVARKNGGRLEGTGGRGRKGCPFAGMPDGEGVDIQKRVTVSHSFFGPAEDPYT